MLYETKTHFLSPCSPLTPGSLANPLRNLTDCWPTWLRFTPTVYMRTINTMFWHMHVCSFKLDDLYRGKVQMLLTNRVLPREYRLKSCSRPMEKAPLMFVERQLRNTLTCSACQTRRRADHDVTPPFGPYVPQFRRLKGRKSAHSLDSADRDTCRTEEKWSFPASRAVTFCPS